MIITKLKIDALKDCEEVRWHCVYRYTERGHRAVASRIIDLRDYVLEDHIFC